MSMILIQAQLEEPGRHHTPRKATRSSVGLPALIVHLSERHSAKLLNLSCGGAMIESTVSVRANDQIMLTCGMIEARGRVAWTKDGLFGIEFHSPLEEHHIVQQLCRSNALIMRRSVRLGAKAD